MKMTFGIKIQEIKIMKVVPVDRGNLIWETVELAVEAKGMEVLSKTDIDQTKSITY